jgi:AcrR family transcriptional regulator
MERSRIATRAGRPRSEAAHQAILVAAVALVREVGYDAATMDGIAARAGVGKATVYRRWSTKEELVAEAVAGIVRSLPAPDTGTTRGDVLALMRRALAMYADPATGLLLSGLVAAMARSAPIARAVRGGLVATWRDALTEILARGVGRGDLRAELAADAEAEIALDLLFGPLFHRYLLTGTPLDDRFARGVVEVALRGLAAPVDATPRARRPRARARDR